jgi:hypothetical protein
LSNSAGTETGCGGRARGVGEADDDGFGAPDDGPALRLPGSAPGDTVAEADDEPLGSDDDALDEEVVSGSVQPAIRSTTARVAASSERISSPRR